jgi:thiol-disulfide isomerase/thioredoxin
LAAIAAAASLAFAQSSEPPKVAPGSPAPATDFSGWVKGTPVYEFEAGKTYVVEFWATWCGPCITSIPHLTKLQKENPEVTFIGFAVWEREKETETIDEQVRKFVGKFGGRMDYKVAIDTAEKHMAESWMTAAEQNGIPTAFIVQDKQIVWVGHPMSLDEPLAAVVNGTHDVAKAREEFMAGIMEGREMAAAQEMIASLRKDYAAGKKTEAIAGLKKLGAEKPQLAGSTRSAVLALMASDKNPGLQAEIDAMLGDKASHQALAQFAYTQSRSANGDKAMAAKFAEAVFKATDDPISLYYAGMACEGCEDFKGSKMVYEKAIAQLAGQDDGPNTLLGVLKARLAAVSAKAGQ